ncbi:MAG: patatin-like phospholipase family protein [Sphingobacteriaceae bacterium]|nr:patatin-like phospholipase family protein [Sphingobacteriaceae bacterium]
MKVEQFTQEAAVLNIISKLKEERIHEKEFSDVTDGTHQYVDLVMEGGGVLGVALAGYVYVLEQMNIRFLQLGGTSAGAINTMLMAAAGPIHEAKTEWILSQICNKDFNDFVDGDRDARGFINALLTDAGTVKLSIKGLQVIDNFHNDLGLNPGNNFHMWMKLLLHLKGIKTLKDLTELRKKSPNGGLYNRYDKNIVYGAEIFERVVIVAADVSTESKIIFPEMANLFWSEPENVCPADFVRATMSIPFFFFPFRVKNIPQGAKAWENWKINTGYVGNTPSEVTFVDGGIMSNFPIDIFHQHTKVPHAPTLGVKLGEDRTQVKKTDKFFPYLGAIFDSARHIHDYNFLLKNPDFQKLICMVNIDGHNWLDFGIKDEAKVDLFVRGAKAASEFLRTFDWTKYKQIRKGLADAYIVANA